MIRVDSAVLLMSENTGSGAELTQVQYARISGKRKSGSHSGHTPAILANRSIKKTMRQVVFYVEMQPGRGLTSLTQGWNLQHQSLQIVYIQQELLGPHLIHSALTQNEAQKRRQERCDHLVAEVSGRLFRIYGKTRCRVIRCSTCCLGIMSVCKNMCVCLAGRDCTPRASIYAPRLREKEQLRVTPRCYVYAKTLGYGRY